MGMLLDANAPLEAELAERHGEARRALGGWERHLG
jgi:hypothetical protein